MGAGDGSGPEHRGQAGQGGKECGEFEFRDEPAAHEQRVRHRKVVERGIAGQARLLFDAFLTRCA